MEVGVAPPNTDPRYGYAILGKTQAAGSLATPGLDGAGRPVPLAPSRLHPTRDFYPGQFYRPSVRNLSPSVAFPTAVALVEGQLAADTGRKSKS